MTIGSNPHYTAFFLSWQMCTTISFFFFFALVVGINYGWSSTVAAMRIQYGSCWEVRVLCS